MIGLRNDVPALRAGLAEVEFGRDRQTGVIGQRQARRNRRRAIGGKIKFGGRYE